MLSLCDPPYIIGYAGIQAFSLNSEMLKNNMCALKPVL